MSLGLRDESFSHWSLLRELFVIELRREPNALASGEKTKALTLSATVFCDPY